MNHAVGAIRERVKEFKTKGARRFIISYRKHPEKLIAVNALAWFATSIQQH
jgi:hypothetical protein